MEISILDSGFFRRAIDALREFLPQAQLRISSAGIHINGMDASHVGFVDFLLSAGDCESIKLPKNENVTIGLSLLILGKVLATSGTSDTLKLAEVGDKLKVSFKTEGRTANYELPTLQIEEDIVQLPEMNYGATVSTKSSEIGAIVKDLALFGDQITLCLDEDGFHVSAEGDVGKGDLTLEPSEERDMTLESDSVKASFGMKYLQQIVKHASSLSSMVELSFDAHQPLRVTSKFGKGSHFIAYLAPKIVEEEE